MKLLFVIDGRSPIALNWVRYFIANGHEVHIISTYPCDPVTGSTTFRILPVAFSQLHSNQDRITNTRNKKNVLLRLGSTTFRTKLRRQFAPLSLGRTSKELKKEFGKIRPDLVHAMRVPYEGMVSAMADPECPLLISIWGNDFTLHARSTRRMTNLTLRALDRCDALHTDCHRDARLAQEWGFSSTKPLIILPGNGGIQSSIFYPPIESNKEGINNYSKESKMYVINPRGIRAYIRNDVFIKSIPMVLQKFPNCKFICPDMVDNMQIMRWISKFGLADNVQLLGKQSPEQMSTLFRKSRVMVSVSEHDGTPNTLLEAMACGCLPVVGDLESIREWIHDGINGILVNPSDPEALGSAIIRALNQNNFYLNAREINKKIIKEKADYKINMQSAQEFYSKVINN